MSADYVAVPRFSEMQETLQTAARFGFDLAIVNTGCGKI